MPKMLILLTVILRLPGMGRLALWLLWGAR